MKKRSASAVCAFAWNHANPARASVRQVGMRRNLARDGADGTRLGEHFEGGIGLLLDFNTDATLQTLAGRWSDRIVYVALSVTDPLGLTALLLTPDGFVAWASDTKPGAGEAAQAAARWFGEA
ncbi:hypothetical protein QTH97_35215 [Variovorax sp. J22R24]|uniref:aromatic-ring hydroxylase C-terminal domain-containing protein n=1 Tax=Variovorax gracilis TaxID=3053502 RepID=UPI0025751D30|nr:hypothetical protein [Variovorax sp. J22R24]MDM0110192.1 hypothetical protein [Variovorax sp. J22R24]